MTHTITDDEKARGDKYFARGNFVMFGNPGDPRTQQVVCQLHGPPAEWRVTPEEMVGMFARSTQPQPDLMRYRKVIRHPDSESADRGELSVCELIIGDKKVVVGGRSNGAGIEEGEFHLYICGVDGHSPFTTTTEAIEWFENAFLRTQPQPAQGVDLDEKIDWGGEPFTLNEMYERYSFHSDVKSHLICHLIDLLRTTPPTTEQPAQGVDLSELSLNLAYKPATHVHALLVKHFTTPPTTGEQETE